MPRDLENDAPLFAQFWLNSCLNPARASLIRERIAEDAVRNPPPPRPRWIGAASPLPPVPESVSEPWAARRSHRRFSPAPLTSIQLSQLLWPLSARADGSRQLPSGGAKYPLLAYALLLAVEDNTPKVAWYDPLNHGLTQIGEAPSWATLAPILGVDWESPPAVVFVITAQPQNMLAKYGERGGRFTLIEAGLYLGALDSGATRLGLAGVALGSFDDRRTLQLLDADPQSELAVITYAVGHPVP